MPVELLLDGIEPKDPQAEIWRFMNFEKFRDLVATGELYFCRADLFKDEHEGLPLEECVPIPDLSDPVGLNNALGSVSQFREGFFLNCWYLFDEEKAHMWKDYGENGVAVCSRFDLLKSALDAHPDRAYLSLIRYGSKPFVRWNILQFITTKREHYRHEQELRAVIWIPDEYAGINRHVDEHNVAHPKPLTPPPDRVPQFQRRKVDLQSLITNIVVSPYAPEPLISEAKRIVQEGGYSIPVRLSGLARFRNLLP